MRPIRSVLKLKFEGFSIRAIASKCGISRPAAGEYLTRAGLANLSWPTCETLDDAAMEELLFPAGGATASKFPQPNWAMVFAEMQQKGATLQVLHEEYLRIYPKGMKYVRFCQLYKKYAQTQRSTMCFEYDPGKIAFVDYAGRTMTVTPTDAEPFKVQLFVGVLGSSGLVFVEATRSQKIADWLASHQRMFCLWGGTPTTVVPDNLKSAVKKASYRGEPEIAFDYLEMMNHYDVNVVPARPRHPRDKAKAEKAVQIATRQVIFRLRNETFRSLGELNQSIMECVAAINNKPIRRLGKSRSQLFEGSERKHLRPLPATAWEISEYHYYRVNLSGHVEFDDHFYSVPFNLNGAKVLLRATANVVDISCDGKHVASHSRSHVRGGHSTKRFHLRPEHAAYLDWSCEEALEAAASIGAHCRLLLQNIFAKDSHLDHQRGAYRSLQNMAKDYGHDRVESACAVAGATNNFQMIFVRNLLRNRREQRLLTGTHGDGAVLEHSNLRSASEFNIHIVPKEKTNAD